MQKYTTNNIINRVVFDRNFNEAKSHKDILSMLTIMKEVGYNTNEISRLLEKVFSPTNLNDKILRLYYLLLHNKTYEIIMSSQQIFEIFLERQLFQNQIDDKEINSIVTSIKKIIKKDPKRTIFNLDKQIVESVFKKHSLLINKLYKELYEVDSNFVLSIKDKVNILQKNISLTIFYGIVEEKDKPVVRTMLKIWQIRQLIEHNNESKRKKIIDLTIDDYKKVILFMKPSVEDDFNSKFNEIVRKVQV